MTLNHRSRKAAFCTLLALLAAAGSFWAAPGLGRREKEKAGPPQDLPGHVKYLVRQLYGVSLDDSGAITSQVRTLVIDSLTSWMSANGFEKEENPFPIDVRVRMHIEQDFSELQYPFFGKVVVFARPWNGSTLIGAGYTLGWSDFERVNVLALFENKDGKTNRVALTDFAPRTDMHYAFLAPSPAGAFRFIVYGNRLGKSQPRLSAILYSFDGLKLSNLWEQRDLYDGKISVSPPTVEIRYLIEQEYIQAVAQGQWPPWHEAIYKATPEGLTLLSEKLAPYQSSP
ncbi:MAG: hypothetical protein KGM47_07875 [Acidobacteriota bacterium]|nr:hypothetical protein [Acidobacteriota bacterium]